MSKNRAEFKANIASEFMSILEEDGLDWNRGWVLIKQHNPVTKTEYKGLNAFRLGLISSIRGYKDPRWLTFNQIADKNDKYHKGEKWHLKKGSKGVEIEYVMPYDLQKEEIVTWEEYSEKIKSKEKTEKSYSLRFKYTKVFNASLVEGIEPYKQPELKDNNLAEMVEKISENMGVEVKFGGSYAYYSPQNDTVHLPDKNKFFDEYLLNSTALHELSHATGHRNRLGRNLSGKFASVSYAYEELVAEITSTMLGVDMTDNKMYLDNHKAYVKAWIGELNNNPDMLINAIKEAEETSHYMEYMAEQITKEEFSEKYPNLAEKVEENKNKVFYTSEKDLGKSELAENTFSYGIKEKIDNLKKINKDVVDNNGKVESFDKQLLKYASNKFEVGKPFIVSADCKFLSYISNINPLDPLIIKYKSLKHIEEKHPSDYSFLSDVGEMIKESVMAFDSKEYDSSKIIVLNAKRNNDPIIAVCRTDTTLHSIDINEINSFYKRNNFSDFIVQTYNMGKNIYCNKKTEDFIRSYEGLPLPKELINLLSNKNYIGVINKSQSKDFSYIANKFINNENTFCYDNRCFCPIHNFSSKQNNIEFISSIYSVRDNLKCDYNAFYSNEVAKGNDLFYCLEMQSIYLPTNKGLMLVPKEKHRHLDLCDNSKEIIKTYEQKYEPIKLKEAEVTNKDINEELDYER